MQKHLTYLHPQSHGSGAAHHSTVYHHHSHHNPPLLSLPCPAGACLWPGRAPCPVPSTCAGWTHCPKSCHPFSWCGATIKVFSPSTPNALAPTALPHGCNQKLVKQKLTIHKSRQFCLLGKAIKESLTSSILLGLVMRSWPLRFSHWLMFLGQMAPADSTLAWELCNVNINFGKVHWEDTDQTTLEAVLWWLFLSLQKV